MTDEKIKIRYYSIDPTAFILDPEFLILTNTQRGLYLTIMLYMCANDGQLNDELKQLQRLIGYRQSNFRKQYDTIKHLFISKEGKITSKLVTCALNRAQKMHDLQKAKGISSAEKRSYENQKSQSAQPSEVKESEGKRSQDKQRDENRREEEKIVSLPIAKSSFSNPFDSKKTATHNPINTDPIIMQIKCFDELCKIFLKRTPSDTAGLHNLTRWLLKEIQGKRFNVEIYHRVLDLAKESTSGRAKKPIALFYSWIKKDLKYRPNEL
jgi:uncharacterized protein YdaU (DUF1376 family)